MSPIMIPVGQWYFYPQFMAACNAHNGKWAFIHPVRDGWAVTCCGCPADWMLKELGDWLATWMRGK